MVATTGIERAIQYYHAISGYLQERKSRCQALVAFSGEHEYGGARVSEASLNGLPSAQIAERFQEDRYRFLVCADQFQTGYDEPLLHTMYVDKTLSGIKAVQTLSVEFKGNAKAFIRTYGFLSAVLPAPEEEDLSKGILDAIDLDSYRVEKQAMQKILLLDEDAEIGPVLISAGGHRPEPELDRLSNILRTFNEHFGDIRWEDADRVTQLITETIRARVAADTAFRNARQNSDRQNARIEHDKALLRVIAGASLHTLHGRGSTAAILDPARARPGTLQRRARRHPSLSGARVRGIHRRDAEKSDRIVIDRGTRRTTG